MLGQFSIELQGLKVSLKFEWDENKNKSNRVKHGIWFEETQSAFDDPRGRLFLDDSNAEDRYILIAMNNQTKILVVVHCYPENGNLIRIISARKASKKERHFYEKGI